MSSSFKRYRQAFSNDQDQFDPSRILSAAMQPPAPMQQPDPGFEQRPATEPEPVDPGFQKRPARFTEQFNPPAPADITPQLDNAMAMGKQADTAKQKKADAYTAGFQGFAAGLSAGVNTHGNFGQGFATALGAAAGVTRGSMQQAEDRRRVEEDRNLEIENMFFNRSVKLQELAQRRREAEADLAADIEDRKIRRDAQATNDRRATATEDRLDESERHNREMERIAGVNAGANVTRAGAAKTKAAATAGKTAPRTAEQIDAYARQRTYVRFGAMNEKGEIVDQEKKENIDEMLARTTGRRNRVQDAYEAARREATKSTVDPSTEDDSE